jgi:hypothetical protein
MEAEGIEMRATCLSILLLLAFALPVVPQSTGAMPIMRSVEPGSGKVGDLLAAHGENLGRDDVAALYLTDGKVDVKTSIAEQKSTSILFRIPAEAKPGRFALMTLTNRGKDRKLIEQPVRVIVEAGASTPPTT